MHNAGYDSKITGECFVLMNKALENKYIINSNDTSKSNNKKKKKPKFEENSINSNSSIKYGFCSLKLFETFENIFQMSLVDNEHGKINLNTNLQTKEDYLKNENDLINNIFKNVFAIKFKTKIDLNQENSFLLNNYEIANFLKNEKFNLNVIKIDYDTFFVEFYQESIEDCKEINELIKNFTNISRNKNNEQLIIHEFMNYKDFIGKLNIY